MDQHCLGKFLDIRAIKQYSVFYTVEWFWLINVALILIRETPLWNNNKNQTWLSKMNEPNSDQTVTSKHLFTKSIDFKMSLF